MICLVCRRESPAAAECSRRLEDSDEAKYNGKHRSCKTKLGRRDWSTRLEAWVIGRARRLTTRVLVVDITATSLGERMVRSSLRTRAAETRGFARTLVHVVLGLLGGLGKILVRIDIPVRKVFLGAGVTTTSRVVSAIALGVRSFYKSLLQSIVVLEMVDLVTVNLDETVLVGSLGVFVNETTRVDSGHIFAVERLDFLKFAFIGVAAIFGKKEWETVAGEILRLGLPSGLLKAGRIAPRVIIESEEVGTLLLRPTIHVLGHFEAVAIYVGLMVRC